MKREAQAKSASSPARPQTPGRKGRKGLRRGILAAFFLALVSGLFVAFSFVMQPHIEKLDPIVVEPGGIVSIAGRNFGEQRGESRVEVDGVAPTASSYLSWSPGKISLRLPAGADSGLVYVVTRRGRSNSKLFMNRARLPVPPKGEVQGKSGPFITSLSSEAGSIGSLLVISGLNFGANRGQGSVSFGWSPDDPNPGTNDRPATYSVANAEVDLGYELWSDKEIRVRVPDGAASGGIVVNSGSLKSNAVFFNVSGQPGLKRYKDLRSYSISYSVNLSRIRSSGPSELYLWVPRPAESASQRISRILAQDPPPYMPEYRGTALYHFQDLSGEEGLAISQSYLVQTWGIETAVDPDKIQKPESPSPLMTAYTQPDAVLPSAAPDIQAMARKITQGEKNPWRASRAVYDYLVKNIAYNPSSLATKPSQALLLRSADSSVYALLAASLLRAAGVPALPVQGYLVDSSRKAVRHAWVEFYVYGLGWVPMDPILGSGVAPGGLSIAFEDRNRYFGNLDNRRIAFSRGFTVLSPMSQAARHASPAKPMALQSFYEEVSGALDAYSSFWSEIEVSGLY